ncbi:hypothetical protein BTR23_06690 [Alkalihalophilus pseudofirmus]|nr:hypothetical protein BTR23_06690 [Alkalihalophilus pseudofirmus]
MKKLLTTSFVALIMTSLCTGNANASNEKQNNEKCNHLEQADSNVINEVENLYNEINSNKDIQSLIDKIQAKYPNVRIDSVKKPREDV